MRPSRTLVMCGAALFAAAGLSIGQEQGPAREPSTTVARPKKADADKAKFTLFRRDNNKKILENTSSKVTKVITL